MPSTIGDDTGLTQAKLTDGGSFVEFKRHPPRVSPTARAAKRLKPGGVCCASGRAP